MRTSLFFLLAAVALAISVPTFAAYYYFQPIGYESAAMGGAGVASATGTMAPYYNPALLTSTKRSMEISAGAGSGIDDQGMGLPTQQWRDDEVKDALSTVNGSLSLSGPPTISADVRTRLQDAHDLLTTVPDGVTMFVQPGVAAGVQLSRLAVGAYATSSIQAIPRIDRTAVDYLFNNTSDGANVYYRYDPTTGATSYNAYSGNGDSYGDMSISGMTYDPTLTPTLYENNSMYRALMTTPKKTYVDLTGEGILEVPVSLAVETKFPLLGMVAIGGSWKYMEGSSTPSPVAVDMDSTGTEVKDAFDAGRVKSTAFGIDAGIVVHPTFMKSLTLGAVGKNLNSPEFKDDFDVVQMRVEPVYRVGANLHLGSGLDLAADYDLQTTEMTDNFGGVGAGSYRYGGVGLNIHSSSMLNLRLGAMKNMEDESNDSLVYTAGLGLGLKWAQVKVAAEVSKDTYDFRDDSSPRCSRVMASFVSTW
jgi:hypothetical protein